MSVNLTNSQAEEATAQAVTAEALDVQWFRVAATGTGAAHVYRRHGTDAQQG